MREKRKGLPGSGRRRRLAGGPAGGMFVRGDGAKAEDFTFVLWAGTGTAAGGQARGAGGGVAGGGVTVGGVAGGVASCQWRIKKYGRKKEKKKEWGKIPTRGCFWVAGVCLGEKQKMEKSWAQKKWGRPTWEWG